MDALICKQNFNVELKFNIEITFYELIIRFASKTKKVKQNNLLLAYSYEINVMYKQNK